MLLEPNASPGDRYEQKYEDKENYMAACDVDKARSSDRYNSVDWCRLDIHDLGFEPR